MFTYNHNRATVKRVFFFLLSLFFLEVSGEAAGPLFLPEVTYGIEEKFIPEKGKPCGERSLYQAGLQAFEQASEPLLLGYLYHTVQQAPIAPHLRVKIRMFVKNTPCKR